MGFFSWLFCSILVVALVLLLFPFSVRIEFEAGERGARALFYFFKKKVYEYEKKWGKEIDDKCVDRESRPSSLGHDRDQHLGQERSDCPKTRDERGAALDERRETSRSQVELRDDELTHRHDRNAAPDAEGVKGDGAEESSRELSSWSEPQASDRIQRTPETEEKRETIAVAKKPTEAPKTECLETRDERQKTSGSQVERRDDEFAHRHDRNAAPGAEGAAISDNDQSETKENAQPAKVKSSSVVEVKESGNCNSEKAETPAEDSSPKKEKRKLSDREFWTILLTPDLDARAFKYVLKILGSVFSLFRMRFMDCFVEGIRTDYQSMGYIAAVNGFMKAYPYVGDWDLRMDWCHEKELRAAGAVRVSISLLRVFCFILETLVLAGILAFSFWRRRARVLKTNKLPEIGFVRKKIVDFIVEE